MLGPRITGLWIYPIKSCRGISLSKMQIGGTGPVHDRQWMIVDEQNQFITLRTESKLSQIITEIINEVLIIRFANLELKINFAVETKDQDLVLIWKSRVFAGVENNHINEALTKYLGYQVKLVRYQSDSARPLGPASTSVASNVMFADSKPVLLVNETSLKDLNSRLTEAGFPKSQIERFRANIIIDGLPAFAEDQALTMTIQNSEFTKPSLCSRCPIISQEVESGKVVSKETLMTLASYRKVTGTKVMFGVYWTPSRLGLVQVGDQVNFSFPSLS